jgi:hypothetical protein
LVEAPLLSQACTVMVWLPDAIATDVSMLAAETWYTLVLPT